MTLESGIKEDATSGREKLLKNFMYNAFVSIVKYVKI